MPPRMLATGHALQSTDMCYALKEELQATETLLACLHPSYLHNVYFHESVQLSSWKKTICDHMSSAGTHPIASVKRCVHVGCQMEPLLSSPNPSTNRFTMAHSGLGRVVRRPMWPLDSL